jgi:acetyltransferase-like isoleucine patch superfamily enzyme
MKKIFFYLKRPLYTTRLFGYYLFGLFFGKFIYPSYLFKSKHFLSIGSIGWEWVFKSFFVQKILGYNRHVPWPVSINTLVSCPENIIFHPNDLNNFMTGGNYFQAFDAKIIIGEGTFIAPNVGIITQNHDIFDPEKKCIGKDVIIGEKCWIGMNSVILPGVILGNNTVVGAGSVVTKSYEGGRVVIAGVPAKIIKHIE